MELIVHVSFELFTALAQGAWLSKLGDASVHTHIQKHTPLTKLLAFFLSIYELTIHFIEVVQKCAHDSYFLHWCFLFPVLCKCFSTLWISGSQLVLHQDLHITSSDDIKYQHFK